MKKTLLTICLISLLSTEVLAHPAGGHHGFAPHHPAPMPWVAPKHHKHDGAVGVVAGLIGGTILASAIANRPQPATATVTTYTPTVYTPAATVYSAPVSQTCYTTTNIITGASTTSCTNNAVITTTSNVVTAAPVTQVFYTN